MIGLGDMIRIFRELKHKDARLPGNLFDSEGIFEGLSSNPLRNMLVVRSDIGVKTENNATFT